MSGRPSQRERDARGNDVKETATEATVAAIANKVTYAGGTTAFFGGLTANELAAIGGLIVAVLGLAVQWYYKRKADRREAEFHAERLRELRGK